jgi:hypothetical protein
MRKYRVLLLLVLRVAQAPRKAGRQSLAEALQEREQGRVQQQAQDRELE